MHGGLRDCVPRSAAMGARAARRQRAIAHVRSIASSSMFLRAMAMALTT